MLGVLLMTAAVSGAPAPVSAARRAFGRDLEVSEPVSGNVVAVLSDVRIDAPVSGNVIVWGGTARFGSNGSVEGNLSVFGGDVVAPAGRAAPVRGAISTPGSLLRLYLEEMHRAPWDEPARMAAIRGVRLVTLSIWLLGSLVLLYFLGSPFARAAARTEEDWTGTLLAGALGVLTLFLAATAALALLPAALSLPIAIAFAGVAVVAKVFGMAALFLLVGQKILKNVSPGRRPAALAAGFAALAAVSLLPVVGPLVWSAASIVAVGVAFLSRFGSPRVRIAIPA
ncbi:MAG TPA: hypothetical protein VE007_01845 [Thermoanaerobaculia bacterium]|nr:hypothetical protein [Thermoanaerobaculia bacterium]